MLQLGDRVRCPHVLFTTDTEGVFATRFQQVIQHRIMCESTIMHAQRLFCDFVQANAFNLGCGSRKVLLHEVRCQTNGFENLGAVVRHGTSRYPSST